MAKNHETQRDYENPSVDTRSELSNLDQEIRGNEGTDIKPDRLTEKEKEEYAKLNRQFYNLQSRVMSNPLSTSDRFALIGSKKPFIDYSRAYPRELIVWTKTFGYTGVRLERYDSERGRPRINEENHLILGLYHNRGELTVEQYERMLDKIQKILDDQENYLTEKQKKVDDKREKKVDDIINNL